MPIYDVPKRAPKTQDQRRGWLTAIKIGFVMVVAISLFLIGLLLNFYTITSDTMAPTIRKGDVIVGSRFIYWFSSLHRGDVVFYRNDKRFPGTNAVAANMFDQRVVALAGDAIKFSDGKLFVNGTSYSYPGQTINYSLPHNGMEVPMENQDYTIPAGTFYTIGDNVSDSLDSRILGPVSNDKLLGKVYAVVWPPNRISWIQ